MRRWLALLLVALLLAPIAEAHVANARPVRQLTQIARQIVIERDGIGVELTLLQNGDPLRNWVRHTVNPAQGAFEVEHRIDASDSRSAFAARWQLERIVEYRDLNRDGRYQEAGDTVVKSWRLANYQWRLVAAGQDVMVGGVRGEDVVWEGNLTGAPRLRVEVVTAGNDFTDEGAYTRPQDILVYLDVLDLPPRAVGSLHAVELTVSAPQETTARLHDVSGVKTGALVDSADRRAMLIWGGEATLDGREQAIEATLGEPTGDGPNRTRAVTLHLPTTDASMRFVVIEGFEFYSESKRAPVPILAPALALALSALLLGRRR